MAEAKGTTKEVVGRGSRSKGILVVVVMVEEVAMVVVVMAAAAREALAVACSQGW